MAQSPTIKGRENLLKHFQATKAAHWKLYNAFDTKVCIMQCNSTMKPAESEKILIEFLDIIDTNGVYILDTFMVTDTKDKSLIRPETTICFTLQERVNFEAPKNLTENRTSGYTPEFGEHIRLIQDNAKLKADYDYSCVKLANALADVHRLENEIKILENFEEEEDEEEEEQGMLGNSNVKDEFYRVAIGLLKENAPLVIQKFTGLKASEVGAVQPTGTAEQTQLLVLFQKLKKCDPNIHKHLHQLLDIAEQQPAIYEMIINKLEEMFKPAEEKKSEETKTE